MSVNCALKKYSFKKKFIFTEHTKIAWKISMMVNHKSQREAKLNLQLALFNDIHMNRKLDNFAHMVCLIFSQIQNWHRARFLCPFF